MGILLAKFCLLTAGMQLIYRFTCQKSTSFNLNRWLLLAGMQLAFVLPWVPLEYETSVTVPLTSPIVPLLQTIEGTTIPTNETATGNIPWLTIVYITGIFVLLSIRLIDVIKICHYIRRGNIVTFPDYTLVETHVKAPFSFGRYILLPKVMEKSGREAILLHEQTHVSQCHYLDLWICEIFCLLQWFNPFAWQYKQSLMQNHEYLADEVASQKIGQDKYRQALTDYWLYAGITNFIHPFAYSTKLARLTMLKCGRTFFSVRRFISLFILILATYGWIFAEPISRQKTQVAANAIELRGNITNHDGILIGAHIVIVGKTIGTISDFDGNFTLKNISPSDTVSIGFPGYESKRFALSEYKATNGLIVLNTNLIPQTKP